MKLTTIYSLIGNTAEEMLLYLIYLYLQPFADYIPKSTEKVLSQQLGQNSTFKQCKTYGKEK